ncbi:hypothetical protein KA977_10000, partial [Candidatus Dependentiae bacterium]|nr:hypothetical protein [Candidatus Dependentiae bacterium]
TMNADWTKIINKPAGIITDSSTFATTIQLAAKADSSFVIAQLTLKTDTAYVLSMLALKADSSALAAKADTSHIHTVSNISDSIPWIRISGTPAELDTTTFALKSEIGMNTSAADVRYLSISADTLYADWSKINGKPTNLSAFINDSSFLTDSTANFVRKNIEDTMTANLNVTGTVKATSFQGDGSLLTGIIINDTKWTESGTNMYRLNGNVGIGTISPTDSLQVAGTIRSDSLIISDTHLIVTKTGYAGIGTANPTQRLYVNGSAVIAPNNNDYIYTYNGTQKFLYVGNQNHIIYSGGPAAGLSINNQSDTGQLVTIQDAGNIGIGITPQFKLHVNGSLKAETMTLTNALHADTVYATKFIGDGSALTGISVDTGGWMQATQDTSYKLSGNVGIGLNNPSDKLTLNEGSIKVIDNGTVNPLIKLHNTNASGKSSIWFYSNTGTINTIIENSNIDSSLLIASGGNIILQDQGLKVGIGTTSPTNNLTVAGTMKVVNRTVGVTNFDIQNTDATNSSNICFVNQNNQVNSLICNSNIDSSLLITSGGNLILQDSGKKIGIGITSPVSILHVVGDATFTDTVSANKFIGDGSLLTGISANGTDTDWTIAAGDTIYKMSGNIGVGTSAPSSLLSIYGDGAISPQLEIKGTASNKIEFKLESGPSYLNYTNGSLNFNNGVNTVLTLSSDGNVGIGNSSPTDSLTINGSVKIGDYVLPASDGSINQVLQTNGSGFVSWATISGSGDSTWTTSGEDIYRLSGKVGIGTNVLADSLTVEGSIKSTTASSSDTINLKLKNSYSFGQSGIGFYNHIDQLKSSITYYNQGNALYLNADSVVIGNTLTLLNNHLALTKSLWDDTEMIRLQNTDFNGKSAINFYDNMSFKKAGIEYINNNGNGYLYLNADSIVIGGTMELINNNLILSKSSWDDTEMIRLQNTDFNGKSAINFYDNMNFKKAGIEYLNNNGNGYLYLNADSILIGGTVALLNNHLNLTKSSLNDTELIHLQNTDFSGKSAINFYDNMNFKKAGIEYINNNGNGYLYLNADSILIGGTVALLNNHLNLTKSSLNDTELIRLQNTDFNGKSAINFYDNLNFKKASIEYDNFNGYLYLNADSIIINGTMAIQSSQNNFISFTKSMSSDNEMIRLRHTDILGRSSINFYDNIDVLKASIEYKNNMGNGYLYLNADSIIIGGTMALQNNFLSFTKSMSSDNEMIKLRNTDMLGRSSINFYDNIDVLKASIEYKNN